MGRVNSWDTARFCYLGAFGRILRHTTRIMILESDRVEIALRLLSNGKYVWTITTNSPAHTEGGHADFLRQIDRELRDRFPDHVQRSGVKAFDIESEDEQ